MPIPVTKTITADYLLQGPTRSKVAMAPVRYAALSPHIRVTPGRTQEPVHKFADGNRRFPNTDVLPRLPGRISPIHIPPIMRSKTMLRRPSIASYD
jgi:hypothetical protein